MSTITMLELRKGAAGIIRRLQKGESFELSYRGRAVGRLEPIDSESTDSPVPDDDPIFHLDRLAEAGPAGEAPLTNEEIDRIVYGS